MAKRPSASSKKSAAPYTPEVVPPPAAPAAKVPISAAKADIPSQTAAIPAKKPAPKPASPITYEVISDRAYYISISGTGGDQDSNWHRAEAELKREADND